MHEINGAFSAYLARSDETGRLTAYELGRQALARGVGLMEWSGSVHAIVAAAIRDAKSRTERARATAAAEAFLLECLSAYEMAFRGAREANDALRRQNELLEAETRRIAHEIHDCAGQLLVSVYMQLHQLSATAPAEVTSVLAHVSSLIDQVQGHLRRFAHELRPTILDDLGLVPALHALGQGVTSRAGITVSVEGSTDGRLPAPIEIALYRAVQEALTNTMKHARAARAEVRVARQVGEVRCTVTDDGIGFPTQESAGGNRGLGLAGLRERLAPLGGRVNWGSVPRGGGAFVTVVIPLEAPYVATRSGC